MPKNKSTRALLPFRARPGGARRPAAPINGTGLLTSTRSHDCLHCASDRRQGTASSLNGRQERDTANVTSARSSLSRHSRRFTNRRRWCSYDGAAKPSPPLRRQAATTADGRPRQPGASLPDAGLLTCRLWDRPACGGTKTKAVAPTADSRRSRLGECEHRGIRPGRHRVPPRTAELG